MTKQLPQSLAKVFPRRNDALQIARTALSRDAELPVAYSTLDHKIRFWDAALGLAERLRAWPALRGTALAAAYVRRQDCSEAQRGDVDRLIAVLEGAGDELPGGRSPLLSVGRVRAVPLRRLLGAVGGVAAIGVWTMLAYCDYVSTSLYERLCPYSGDACAELAHRRLRGNHVLLPDEAQALFLFKRARSMGSQRGALGYAYLLDKGVSDPAVPADQAKVVAYQEYRRLCSEQDVAVACHNKGLSELHGEGTQKSREDAKDSLRRACEGDWGDACDWLSRLKAEDHAPAAEVERLSDRGCRHGSLSSCQRRANLLAARGEVAAARQEHEDLCARSGLSCYNAAVFAGRLMAPAREVAQLERRACYHPTSPDHAACRNVGFRAETGDGVATDRKEAEQAYRLGCESGVALACFSGGALAERQKDLARAAELYQKGQALGCEDCGRRRELLLAEDGGAAPAGEQGAK